jgi:hypothetical protein
MSTRIEGDLIVTGQLVAQGAMSISAGAIGDSQIAAGAGIDVDKLDHQYLKGFGQPNTAATDETRPIHVARSAGTVDGFVAGSIAKAVGDSTVTIDLKKNGTTILSAVITLDSGNTNRVVETGTVSSAAYVAGDWFEVVIDATIGTGTLPTGVYAQAVFSEAAA